MALEITYYARPRMWNGQTAGVTEGGDLGSEAVAVGAGSTQSGAFPARTELVAIVTNEACRVAFGANPTAANAGALSRKLLASSEYYFSVEAGQKIAVIAAS